MATVRKICSVCGLLAEHGTRRQGQPSSWCRDCQRTYNQAHYQANSTKAKQRAAERRLALRLRNRGFIRKAKNRPCHDCGITYPYYVMQFDHRQPEHKTFTISNKGLQKPTERLMEEIAKCDVVCGNCHSERTHRQRSGTMES